MEPISVVIGGGLLVFRFIRFITRSERKEAAAEHERAIQRYEEARAGAVQQQAGCINDLHFLAVNRKACLSWQLSPLDRLATR